MPPLAAATTSPHATIRRCAPATGPARGIGQPALLPAATPDRPTAARGDPLVTIPRSGIVPPHPAAGHDRQRAGGAICRRYRHCATGWAAQHRADADWTTCPPAIDPRVTMTAIR